MNTSVIYTVFSVINLIGYVVGIFLLPDQVPIHFNASLTADAVGSPWVFVALPAASTLISAAIWTLAMSKRERIRKILTLLLSVAGAVLSVLGWIFFSLITSGVQAGERAQFPLILCIVLPLSIFFIFFGVWLLQGKRGKILKTPETKELNLISEKVNRLLGSLFISSGAVSAVFAVVFSCIPGNLSYISAIVFAASVLLPATGYFYAKAAAKKERIKADVSGSISESEDDLS